MMRVVRQRLLREVVDVVSLETFKVRLGFEHPDLVGDVYDHCRSVGLYDLQISLSTQKISDSMVVLFCQSDITVERCHVS